MSLGHTILGNGKEIAIVLHGWMTSAAVYEPIYSSLDTETFTFVFVDYRGCGKSKNIAGEYNITEIYQDILTLCDENNWQEFHLVGHSMGGVVLQKLIAVAEARIKSAIAITPVPASGVPQNEEEVAFFSGTKDQDENRYFLFDSITGNRLSTYWLNTMVKNSRETNLPDAILAYYQSWSNANFVDEINGKEKPVLICVGDQDAAITREIMEATCMQWFPNAELEMLPNAGHYPMQETPVYLATVINNYLNKHC